MDEQKNLEIVLRVKEELSAALKRAEESLSNVQADLQKTGKAGEDALAPMGNRLEKLNTQWAAMRNGFVQITAAVMAMKQAWNLADAAADYREKMTSLNALTRQFGTTAQTLVADIQKASEGMISMGDAASTASEAMARGLSPEQITRMAGAATTLSQVTGQTTTEAFKSLSEAIALGRERALENSVGIIDLSAKYGHLTSKMSDAEKQAARYQIVMEKVNKLQGELGAGAKSADDDMQRLTAQVKDVTRWLGEGLLRVGYAVAGMLNHLASGVMTAYGGIFKIAQGIAFIHSKIAPTEKMREQGKLLVEEFRINAEAAFGAGRDIAEKALQNYEAVFAPMDQVLGSAGEKVTKTLKETPEVNRQVLDDLAEQNRQFVEKYQYAGMTQRQVLEAQWAADKKYAEQHGIAVQERARIDVYYSDKLAELDKQDADRKKAQEDRVRQEIESRKIALSDALEAARLTREKDLKDAGDNAELKILIEQDYQKKVKEIRDQADASEQARQDKIHGLLLDYEAKALESQGLTWEAKLVKLQEQQAAELELFRAQGATKEEIERLTADQAAAISQANAEHDKELQQKKAEGWQTFTATAGGLLGSLATVFGTNEKKMFAVNKLANMANAVANVAAGITKALSVQNWGAAALTAVQGAAQIATIARQKFEGGGGGVSFTGGGTAGGATTPADILKAGEEKAKAAPVINLHVYGNIVDHDKFAREMVPALARAAADGAH